MIYKVLADTIVALHLLWIIFMVGGFFYTIAAFFHKALFDRWLLRLIHIAGIAYVSFLAVTQRYCPLTLLENALRRKHDPFFSYPGSFIIHYAERVIYLDVNPLAIQAISVFIAVFSVVVFIIKPPEKIKKLFKKASCGSQKQNP